MASILPTNIRRTMGGSYRCNDGKNKLRAGPGGIGTDNPMGLPQGPPPTHNRDEGILYPVMTALKIVAEIKFEKDKFDFKTWKVWWEQNKGTFKFNRR